MSAAGGHERSWGRLARSESKLLFSYKACCAAELCCERAQLADGQAILELGCGWGSLALFMAARYPAASISAVSNSRTQKALIDARAQQRGLTNLVRA